MSAAAAPTELLGFDKVHHLSAEEYAKHVINHQKATSILPGYEDSIFAVIVPMRPEVSCLQNFVVERFRRMDVTPTPGKTCEWPLNKVCALKVAEDTGLSDREDLKGYQFVIERIGALTLKGPNMYRVTMTDIKAKK